MGASRLSIVLHVILHINGDFAALRAMQTFRLVKAESVRPSIGETTQMSPLAAHSPVVAIPASSKGVSLRSGHFDFPDFEPVKPLADGAGQLRDHIGQCCGP